MHLPPVPSRTAALATLLLALAGCGGSAEPAAVPSTPATASPTATDTPSPSPTPSETASSPTAAPSTPASTPSPAASEATASATPAADPSEACGEEDYGITVVAPVDGATISDGVTLAGCGSTFEATYQWEVEYEDGSEPDGGFGTMTCGSGCIGTFEEPLALTGSGPATLRVYEASAEDGEPTNVVELDVTVE